MKCFKCEKVYEKLTKGKGIKLPNLCINCKKLAPRQSLRPFNAKKK